VAHTEARFWDRKAEGYSKQPVGIFVTSTPCIADTMKFLFKVMAPIGRFEIDLQWQADVRKSPFIIAKKPA